MKQYQAICNIELVADNPCKGIKSQTVTLYKEEPFTVYNKQKDMYDPNVEYWMNVDCWVLKITQKELDNLVEV